jgi:predicted Rossmann fold flavoprotein
MGATGLGYRIAAQFGVPLTEVRPGLVPLTFSGETLVEMADLAGVAVTAQVSCNSAAFSEGLLFTHRGLSGPSILQVSSYWGEGEALTVDLATGRDVAGDLRAARSAAGRGSLARALAGHLPERVARAVVIRSGLAGNLADQSNSGLDRLADAVHRWQVTPAGSEGYRTAEVTVGGVSTDALDARSMAAGTVPGLHFIGEVVDVTGWLGGYNFQWAWSSGWAAGQAV